jgi:steroid delta-isomerase-like uncharacterized protein
MSLEQNKAVVRRWIEAGWNQSKNTDPNFVREIFAEDWVDLNPPPGQPAGADGIDHFVAYYRAALPDAQLTIDRMLAEGDEVVFRWTARGTHMGNLGAMPPSGKSVKLTGITWHRLAGGKIVESYAEIDSLTLLQQLGVISL